MQKKSTIAEENYLKAIYKLGNFGDTKITNVTLAGFLRVNPPTALEMVRKLNGKKLLIYNKTAGISLTANGKKIAVQTIRKHRLWEVFLSQQLGFSWDEVHDIAEQLEHIESKTLIERLDKFLGFPVFDPHGDPIPGSSGRMHRREGLPLSQYPKNKQLCVVGVTEHAEDFLKYLTKIGINLGVRIKIRGVEAYDKSLSVSVAGKKTIVISEKAAHHIMVKTA